MTIRKSAIIAALLVSGAPVITITAQAQDTAGAPEQPGGGLEEIVVTAQKRGENLQRTPIAITALTAEDLQVRRIDEVKSIAGLAPNVSVVGGTINSTAAVVSIRGIFSANDETQGFDSPIGIYLNGVYLARSSATTFDVGEIERIEVLRGPQGTLFGRNTTGGAINVITKLPAHEVGASAEFGLGNFGSIEGRATINSGDLGALRLSATYLHKQRNGTVDNLLETKDRRDPGAYNIDSGRLTAVLDASDTITFTNIFDYSDITSTAMAAQFAAVGDGTVRPGYTIDGGQFAAVQPANVAAFLAQATPVEAGCSITPSARYRSTTCMQFLKPVHTRIWGNMFRAEISVGGTDLRSTTAYREWKETLPGNDIDGLGTINGPLLNSAALLNGFPVSTLSLLVPAQTAATLAALPVDRGNVSFFNGVNHRGQHQFSQEIELVSKDKGPLQWAVGAFFFSEHGTENVDQNLGVVVDTNAAVFTSANFGGAAPVLQATNPARYRVITSRSNLTYASGGRSFAVYGQGTYRPGDGPLGITLGLRYTWDRKTMSRTQNGATPFSTPADLALNNPAPAHFKAPTGNLTIDYRATPDVNLYARIARGYRSGGFNARQTTNAAANLPLRPFDNETIWSYEIGAKTQFFNRLRLNAAAFYNRYSNQQISVPIPIVGGGNFGTQIVNAGRTDYAGFELEGEFKVNRHWTLDGNFGYLDVKVKQFTSSDVTGVDRNIASVVSPTYTPKLTINGGVTARYPLGDAQLTGRVSYAYVSGFTQFGNAITAPFQDVTRGTARNLLDASLRVDDIRLGALGGFSLAFWGKNLLNDHWVSRSVDFGQLGYATRIFGDPRTYGATVGVKF